MHIVLCNYGPWCGESLGLLGTCEGLVEFQLKALEVAETFEAPFLPNNVTMYHETEAALEALKEWQLDLVAIDYDHLVVYVIKVDDDDMMTPIVIAGVEYEDG